MKYGRDADRIHVSGERQGFDRRDFLTGVGGAAMLAAGSLGCQGGEPASSSSGAASSRAVVPEFELEEASFGDLGAKLESGELDCRGLVERYLARIEALNLQGPELRCVIEVNPDALALAEELDRELAAGNRRGPLHGVPILLKDNIDTADRNTTTAGSHALAGSIPAQDSFVAERLRAAGAVLLGKANLSEWANFRSSRSSSGWSGRGGQCRNPYVLDRNPCGSSSGSGAAASANLCAAAIGSETDGSIVCPSSANGLVGIKPTLGLVSRSGIVPIAHSQDTAGPMARSVSDAALLLGALTGVDPRDEATSESAGKALADYRPFLDASKIAGARIGVHRADFGFHSDVDRIMEEALAALREAGAELVDPVEMPGLTELRDQEFQVLLYEFKHDLNLYLASLGPEAPARTLEDLIRYNEEHRDQEMPYFGQEIFEQAQEKGDLSEPAYRKALAESKRSSRERGLDLALAGDGKPLDAIVAPTGGPAWTTDLVNGDHFGGGSSTGPAVAGYPNVTVPAGYVHGLPVGISFMGPAWSEPRLISIAYAFEQITKQRRAPRFLPSVG